MNKFYFIVVVILASGTVRAQNLVIGVTAGGNLSKFKFTENLDFEYPDRMFVPGLSGGVRAGFNFNENFGLHTGLEFIERGSRYSQDNWGFEVSEDNYIIGYSEWEEKLRYLSIPLTGRWQSGGEDGGFILSAGFSFNLGIKATIVQRFESPDLPDAVAVLDEENTFGTSARDVYRPMKPGFIFSPGYMFSLGEHGRLTVSAGFDAGLGDSFNKKWKDFTTIIGENINRTLFLNIGYEYHFEVAEEVY